MTFLDSAFWLFMGLITIGVILIVLKLFVPTNKLRLPTQVLFGERHIQDWERKFAWTPVRVDGNNALWLKYYWMRKVYAPAEEDGTFDENSFYYQKVTKIGWYLW